MSFEMIVYAALWRQVRRPGGLIPRSIRAYDRYLARSKDLLNDFKTKFPVNHPELRDILAELVDIVDDAERIVESLRYQEGRVRDRLVEAVQS